MSSRYGLPDDVLVYAIGDVHGEAALLDRLLVRIEEDAEQRAARRRLLVYLGDYVDRGPDSRGVVDRLLEGPPSGFEQICLVGNHEEMMLGCLEGDPRSSILWLMNGGDSTCRSYGIDPTGGPTRLRQALLSAMPAGHEELLRNLSLCHQEGDYFFVHAGIRPGVALAKQRREDMVWIRKPFCESKADHGCVVVHGHSPVQQPDDLPNRIGIDTGAVYGNALTAVALQGGQRHFIQVKATS